MSEACDWVERYGASFLGAQLEELVEVLADLHLDCKLFEQDEEPPEVDPHRTIYVSAHSQIHRLFCRGTDGEIVLATPWYSQAWLEDHLGSLKQMGLPQIDAVVQAAGLQLRVVPWNVPVRLSRSTSRITIRLDQSGKVASIKAV